MRPACTPPSCAGSAEVQFRAEATRSLKLLNAIEDTITYIGGVTDLLRVVVQGADAIVEGLSRAEPDREVDPDDELVHELELIQESCKRLHARYLECAQAARADDQLTEEDGVAGAYDAVATAVVDVHDAFGGAIFEIRQHDALASSVSEPFTSADDLIAHLHT